MSEHLPEDFSAPLCVEEVVHSLRKHWGATYDIQLVTRKDRLYFQVMWAHLEQQSFPMDEDSYRIHINDVLEVVNRLGLAEDVRIWLRKAIKKPRVGRAVSLPLKGARTGCLEEFVL